MSSPPSVADADHVEATRRPRTCTSAPGPRRRCRPPEPTDVVRAAVPRTVTVSGCASPPPPNAVRSTSTVVASVPARSLTMIVSAPPSALEADRLDVVEVHHDVGDVAEEADAAAVGGDVDRLADVAADEVERRRCRLAVDDVAAVAGVPLEAVVAVAQQRLSAPWLPSTKSLPAPPMRRSAPLPPRACRRPRRRRSSAGQRPRGCRRRRHRVGAAEPEHDEALDDRVDPRRAGRLRRSTSAVGDDAIVSPPPVPM